MQFFVYGPLTGCGECDGADDECFCTEERSETLVTDINGRVIYDADLDDDWPDYLGAITHTLSWAREVVDQWHWRVDNPTQSPMFEEAA